MPVRNFPHRYFYAQLIPLIPGGESPQTIRARCGGYRYQYLLGIVICCVILSKRSASKDPLSRSKCKRILRKSVMEASFRVSRRRIEESSHCKLAANSLMRRSLDSLRSLEMTHGCSVVGNAAPGAPQGYMRKLRRERRPRRSARASLDGDVSFLRQCL